MHGSTVDHAALSRADDSTSPWLTLAKSGLTPGVLVLCTLIALANTHLIGGGFGPGLVFLPDAVLQGQWYRVLTFPFVHVSWYHLALDASAFLLLYKEVEDTPLRDRLLYLALPAGMSLAVAWLSSPLIAVQGLCGLSGIAHGLMAVAALRMLAHENERALGAAMFGAVILKSGYEAFTGNVLLEFLHFGLCGSPVAASHAGGVLGGILAYYLLNGHAHARSG